VTDWFALCTKGASLDASQRDALEELPPEQLTAEDCVRMIGYYRSLDPMARRPMARYAHWLIVNRPDIELFGDDVIYQVADPEGYQEAKRLWIQTLETRTDDASLFGRAAMFLDSGDVELAWTFASRAAALEPNNPAWSSLLGSLAARGTRATDSAEDQLAAARLSLAHHERALADARSREDRYSSLVDVAEAAFDVGDLTRARNAALEVVDGPNKVPKTLHPRWQRSVYTVLGLVAIEANDLPSAREHLLASACAFISSREPIISDFSLARRLLELGERSVVIRYLEACEALSAFELEPFAAWKVAIASGEIPAHMHARRRQCQKPIDSPTLR
jgi:hypothetical protein